MDLDDYNNDTEDGCHITSMAGTWMSIIKGFAGQSVQNNLLHLAPFLPKQWKSYRFKINFRQDHLEIEVNREGVKVQNLANHDTEIVIHDKKYQIVANSTINL